MAHEELHLNLRNLTLDDYDQLQALMDLVYEDIGGAWPKDTIRALVEQFPDGQIGIEDCGAEDLMDDVVYVVGQGANDDEHVTVGDA